LQNPKSGEQTLVVLSAPPVESWLSHLPNDMALGDVALPGTHQSTALYGCESELLREKHFDTDLDLLVNIKGLSASVSSLAVL
jgi:hypothetical protein